MPPFPQLIGGTYTGMAVAADAERSINCYPEKVEAPGSEEQYILVSKPGLKRFCNLSGTISQTRGLVQKASAQGVVTIGPGIGTGTISCDFQTPVTRGNTIVVAVGGMPEFNPARITEGAASDSQGNDYTQAFWIDRAASDTPPAIGVFFSQGVTGGNNTVTFTYTANPNSGSGWPFQHFITIFEYAAFVDPISAITATDSQWTHHNGTLSINDNSGTPVTVVVSDDANQHSYGLADFSSGKDFLFAMGITTTAPDAESPISIGITPAGYTTLTQQVALRNLDSASPGGVSWNDWSIYVWDSGSTTLPPPEAIPLAITEINGRCFVAAQLIQDNPQNGLFEIYADGTSQFYGYISADNRPQLCASQTQLLILSGGDGYIFDLASNSLSQITAEGWIHGASKACFIDGYFICLEPNSQKFFISGLNDGSAWDPLDFGDAEGEPGDVVSIIADHRLLWFLSNTHSQVYYNSGNADFPFTRLENGFMEQGCDAIDSLDRFDNSIVWVGRNKDGARMVWRANGYTPQRISNHSVEAFLRTYPTVSDCRAYAYQEGGHTFYVMHFPTANATWVYDASTGFWHERGSWDSTINAYRADLARCHAYAFEKHLVCDYTSGWIYEQSMSFYDDAGQQIRRLRSAPDIRGGGKWTYYNELRLMLQSGMGLDGGDAPEPQQLVDDSGTAVTLYGDPIFVVGPETIPTAGTDPRIIVQISNDGGFTWGYERSYSMGQIGEFSKLIRARQLGRSRNRAFRIICSDPILFAVIGADLDIQRVA